MTEHGPGHQISVVAPDGVGEVRRGADLADLLLPLVELLDGDVVCVTSKVVSKAEGRVRPGDREDVLAEETRRVVARRGPLSIVVNRLGLTMAAAGIDASNVETGHVVLLPEDPDASARRLRSAILERTGRNVGVLVTDTAGRAWREGQTDMAIGAAGLRVVDDHSGRHDAYGNLLAVTAPAVADELAGAAELATGKLSARPFAVVRGRADLVLPPDDPGPGAGALLRPPGADLFALGTREAVLTALAGREVDRPSYGAPAPADEVATVLAGLTGGQLLADGEAVVVTGLDERGCWVAEVAAYALGWRPDGQVPQGIRVRPAAP